MNLEIRLPSIYLYKSNSSKMYIYRISTANTSVILYYYNLQHEDNLLDRYLEVTLYLHEHTQINLNYSKKSNSSKLINFVQKLLKLLYKKRGIQPQIILINTGKSIVIPKKVIY